MHGFPRGPSGCPLVALGSAADVDVVAVGEAEPAAGASGKMESPEVAAASQPLLDAGVSFVDSDGVLSWAFLGSLGSIGVAVDAEEKRGAVERA